MSTTLRTPVATKIQEFTGHAGMEANTSHRCRSDITIFTQDESNAQPYAQNERGEVFPDIFPILPTSLEKPMSFPPTPRRKTRRVRKLAPPSLKLHHSSKAPLASCPSVGTLAQGPAGYLYTPLSMRGTGFESLEYDHGIACMSDGAVVWLRGWYNGRMNIIMGGWKIRIIRAAKKAWLR
ncbi:hypothetical protein GQ44DRAFT_763309 [Phaeosphaeriaceae sp. PMI808]|nr:hypothetical protein GQ44DRAFT_763309 [Phaeosphaeriaceae sp. PMI808]